MLSAELLNSAIEAITDKASPEFHELAGRAKDMGSAAVLFLMFNVDAVLDADTLAALTYARAGHNGDERPWIFSPTRKPGSRC